jgi:hypothetical protein
VTQAALVPAFAKSAKVGQLPTSIPTSMYVNDLKVNQN